MNSVIVKQRYQFKCLLLFLVLEQQVFCREYPGQMQRHLLNFKLKNVLNQIKYHGNNPLKRQWVASYFICEYKTMYRALSLGFFLRRQHLGPS